VFLAQCYINCFLKSMF